MRRGIWATLDCDPTSDRGAIRRAYAARLKAMDVDADPDAFEALRDARDAALARVADPVADVDVAAVDLPDAPLAPMTEFTLEQEPEPEAEVDALAEAMNAHFHALEALLFPGHDAALTAEELAEIDRHGRALLADPRLENLDFVTGAERWFAETLAASIPRSDPLLEPAAAVFGWIERRNDYALSAEAHAIVERIGATRFAHLVSQPDHRFHKAWQRLSGERDASFKWFNHDPRTGELLQVIRERYPAAEQWLDPDRVAQCRTPPKDNPRISLRVWIALILIVVAARIGMSWWSQPSREPDANYIAQTLTGRDLAELQKINSGLAVDIVFEVANAKPPEGGSGEPVTNSAIIGKLTDKRLRAGMSQPPDDLLVRLTRFDLAAMRILQQRSPAACPSAMVAVDPAPLPEPLREEQRALLREVILHTNNYPSPNVEQRFSVPGAIIDDVAKRTGWSMSRVREVLRDDKDMAARCTLEIALREAGLAAQNGMGMELLRNLQPLVVNQQQTQSQ